MLSPSSVFFRVGLEVRQCLIPQPIDVVAERLESRGVYFIEPASADLPVAYQAGRLERAEVLRHCGAAHGKCSRELADRERSLPKTLQHCSASAVSKCVNRYFVSLHLR